MSVRVEITGSPELLDSAFELSRCRLLEYLEKLPKQNVWGFVQRQMHVFRHEDICENAGAVTRAGDFEKCFDDRLCICGAEEWGRWKQLNGMK